MEKQGNKRWDKIKERLQHQYRLVVMNDETFEEVGSYKLTWMNVYIALSVFLVLLVTIVVLLFAFTPIKRYLPGYSTTSTENSDLYKIEKRIIALEKEVNAREIYIKSVQDALTNNVEYKAEDGENVDGEETADNEKENIEPSAEDYQLRRVVERGKYAGNDGEITGNIEVVNRSIDQMFFVPPLKGTTSAGFRPDKKHYGIDIVAPRNTAIKAVADGVVITSDWTYDTGNVIAVQHENNIVSFYKHNSVLLKKVGSFVKAGEAVAIIGNTGELTDGPHLHFELWYNGNPVNPAEYVNF
ncbi:MAG: M23 family metallopeptidase [Saprospiraceae bacterium]